MSPSSRSRAVLEPASPPAECGWPAAEGHLVGSGLLHFFGLSIYTADLWARGRFDAAQYERFSFALDIRYDRRLGGESIAERSIAEMRRVAQFGPEDAQRWFDFMKSAFPDVAAGDRLTGTYDGRLKTCFFHNGRETACLEDARFARLFFGIWLSERTSAPALRAQLLGTAKS